MARPLLLRGPDPIAGSAFRRGAVASGLVLLAAFIAAAVRLLPWVLDPTIPWPTLSPFASSLFAVAFEAAILTGWPVGWALAAQRLVERGEARALATLGEAPARTVRRLAPQAALFVALLAASSVLLGQRAVAPGRVVDDLLAEGRADCARDVVPATHAVPFVGATWLCRAGAPPRLVGRAPLGGAVFSASSARVSDDLRRIDLDDARLALGARAPDEPALYVHVAKLSVRGLSPWARASSLPVALRAVVIPLSGLAAACAVVFALLAMRRRVSAVAAVALGASGPLASLVVLRALELRVPEVAPGAWLFAFALVPAAAVAAVALAAWLAARSSKILTGIRGLAGGPARWYQKR